MTLFTSKELTKLMSAIVTSIRKRVPGPFVSDFESLKIGLCLDSNPFALLRN